MTISNHELGICELLHIELNIPRAHLYLLINGRIRLSSIVFYIYLLIVQSQQIVDEDTHIYMLIRYQTLVDKLIILFYK